ncbi:Flagellar biosynthetic protein FlhB [Thalassocella blandensis]|nr:Flagellar biosynthetic protein FlhB [Thalassocella blandensis]
MTDELELELKRAVALFYDGQEAPTITAKGDGLDADEIIRIAMENDVPLCDNPPLVELLSHMELGDSIPQELYVAVAHIIAFAYQMRMGLNNETP